MEERESKKKIEARRIRERQEKLAPGYMRTWANDAQVGHTPWDFTLEFAQVDEATDDRIAITKTVSVSVSPLFALRLVSALRENIKNYEQAFGEIHVPEVLREIFPKD